MTNLSAGVTVTQIFKNKKKRIKGRENIHLACSKQIHSPEILI